MERTIMENDTEGRVHFHDQSVKPNNACSAHTYTRIQIIESMTARVGEGRHVRRQAARMSPER